MIPYKVDPKNENAHEDFQKWRRANQDGFIVKPIGKTKARLHRTICPHWGDTEWTEGKKNWWSLGRTTKYCWRDKDELKAWVEKELKIKLEDCTRCNP